jgi:hypothetical protein
MIDGPPAGAERRRHPRYELLAQVRVNRGREDIVMEMVNMSLSGALIDMGSVDRPRWVDVGRTLEISITHPVSLDLVEVSGRIVRILEDESGTRVAVEFVDPSEEASKGLQDLLDIAAASEAPRPGPPPLPKG